jgi:hypothetical protein
VGIVLGIKVGSFVGRVEGGMIGYPLGCTDRDGGIDGINERVGRYDGVVLGVHVALLDIIILPRFTN